MARSQEPNPTKIARQINDKFGIQTNSDSSFSRVSDPEHVVQAWADECVAEVVGFLAESDYAIERLEDSESSGRKHIVATPR